MLKLTYASAHRTRASSTANSPHQPVGADTQLQLLPAIGTVPLGTPGGQVLQTYARKMEPLLLTVLLIVARNHRAPADIAASAISRLCWINWFLLFLESRFQWRSAGSGRSVWLRSSCFLLGSRLAPGYTDFRAFMIAVRNHTGGRALAASGGRFGCRTTRRADVLIIANRYLTVATSAQAGSTVRGLFAHCLTSFEHEGWTLGGWWSGCSPRR